MAAVDFSPRSERAIQRAARLARDARAKLTFVHVVDDDQAPALVNAAHGAAVELLAAIAQALEQGHGLACDTKVVPGDAFDGIIRAAHELDADLVVIGAHRRRMLADIFVGTTAERAIRRGSRPVLMANARASDAYRHMLVAVDFSECSADALHAVQRLALDVAQVTVAHALPAVPQGSPGLASVSAAQYEAQIGGAARGAESELAAFLARAGFEPDRAIVVSATESAAGAVVRAARETHADLIVLGTRSRSGLPRLLLGSVAEEVLRLADVDVLAVPPAARA
jgi:nucleotide-binding universal stress UspA family protein